MNRFLNRSGGTTVRPQGAQWCHLEYIRFIFRLWVLFSPTFKIAPLWGALGKFIFIKGMPQIKEVCDLLKSHILFIFCNNLLKINSFVFPTATMTNKFNSLPTLTFMNKLDSVLYNELNFITWQKNLNIN